MHTGKGILVRGSVQEYAGGAVKIVAAIARKDQLKGVLGRSVEPHAVLQGCVDSNALAVHGCGHSALAAFAADAAGSPEHIGKLLFGELLLARHVRGAATAQAVHERLATAFLRWRKLSHWSGRGFFCSSGILNFA